MIMISKSKVGLRSRKKGRRIIIRSAMAHGVVSPLMELTDATRHFVAACIYRVEIATMKIDICHRIAPHN